MRPCDAVTPELLKQLPTKNYNVTSKNDIDLRFSSKQVKQYVTLTIGHCSVEIFSNPFKKIAEWYLADQSSNNGKSKIG